jgi:putative addiction module component (TIGR02574 family)
MISEEIKQEVSRLGLAEKLIFVADVWDSIALSNSELPLPEWQKRELDKRYKEYLAGKQNLHNWKSVHEGLRDE